MSWKVGEIIVLALFNAVLVLALAPLAEGLMRKLKAIIHSRTGPPIIQPYLDLAKLLGKEDLRVTTGLLYAATPALTLASVLLLATLVPMGTRPALGFAGDVVVLLYVTAASAVLMMLTAFASRSPYAFVGGSREMMLLMAVEPVMAVALVTGAVKAGSLETGAIMDWQVANARPSAWRWPGSRCCSPCRRRPAGCPSTSPRPTRRSWAAP